MRVFVLRGFLSKYVEELELSPGWHRLPNGVIVYSDPIAIRLADARQSVDGEWKSRMTLLKDKDGMWRQLELRQSWRQSLQEDHRGPKPTEDLEFLLPKSPQRLLGTGC